MSKSLAPWTSNKAPLIPEKFTAEVQFDGKHDIPLMELANRHRAEGYKITEEYFKKTVGSTWAPREVNFVRITIERGQLGFND